MLRLVAAIHAHVPASGPERNVLHVPVDGLERNAIMRLGATPSHAASMETAASQSVVATHARARADGLDHNVATWCVPVAHHSTNLKAA
eukprot:COSAG01_NODE_63073_length_281_cov_1.131868_1_plen_88_part_01